MAIMQVVRPQRVSFLLGLFAALAFAAHAKSTSEFQISVTAKGKIEMECSDGCAWEQLSWTCSEDDPSQAPTVVFNEYV
jgi:hypothetical protein